MHNSDRYEEILNRIMQSIISIISSALVWLTNKCDNKIENLLNVCTYSHRIASYAKIFMNFMDDPRLMKIYARLL